MKPRGTQKKSRSLADLGKLIDRQSQAVAPEDQPRKPAETVRQPLQKSEGALFSDAMADVKPISSQVYWQMPKRKSKKHRSRQSDNPELEALRRLVDEGEGFRVSDTPEYMEAAGPGVDRALVRRLHQGRYAVQGHLDLHGCTKVEAEQILSQFIHDALMSGKRMVLVIHGRGLTSPGQPVLKNMVYQWLIRGPFRRYILAFTSARACDGGAGATYVLLRQRPWSKKKNTPQRG
jgi:DNA-nicking Smr family endonuclease